VALEVRILAVWAWWRQGRLVRRRILALTAPVAGSAAMVTYGFAGPGYQRTATTITSAGNRNPANAV